MTNSFGRKEDDMKALGMTARNLRIALNEGSFDGLMNSHFLSVKGYIHKALDNYFFVKEKVVPAGRFDSVQAELDYHNFRKNHTFLALQEGDDFSARMALYSSALNAIQNGGKVPDGIRNELNLFLEEIERSYS